MNFYEISHRKIADYGASASLSDIYEVSVLTGRHHREILQADRKDPISTISQETDSDHNGDLWSFEPCGANYFGDMQHGATNVGGETDLGKL